MDSINDIHIVGLDDKRPPRLRKEPYIDLFFRLSHQAPADWCSIFNTLLEKHASRAKIKVKEGLFIEAWVKTPDDIPALLALLKDRVAECSRLYIEKIELSVRNAGAANAELMLGGGEQGRLNRIVAALDFSLPESAGQ
jgi:hypothetical protein